MDHQKPQKPSFSDHGRTFHFNDHVCMEALIGVSDEKRTGRLVQMRKGCGQFGSNTYLVRLRDGSLTTFENVLIRHVGDTQFEDAYYRFNGMTPPVIPSQAPHDDDEEDTTYTIMGEWPETGFIVEFPSQPQTPGAFSFAVISR